MASVFSVVEETRKSNNSKSAFWDKHSAVCITTRKNIFLGGVVIVQFQHLTVVKPLLE